MPQIPVYQQRTSATASLNLAPINPNAAAVPAAAAGALAQTIGQIAPQVAEVAQRIEVSKNAWQIADATAKTLGELQQFRGELQADEDFDSHSAKFLQKAKDIEERTAQTLKGPALQVWRQDFRRISQENALSVAIDAQKLKASKVRAELGNTLFSLSELTGMDPSTDAAVRAQARLAIESSAVSGNLSFTERNDFINKFDQDASEASIRRDMLNDPEAAEVKLATGAYPHLSGEAQAIWSGRLAEASEHRQRMRLQEDEHAHTLAERAKRDASEAAAKDGDNLLAHGQLTTKWIDQNRAALSESDYRYFLRALSGEGEAPRDPAAYLDLRTRAGKGEDIRADARDALHRGQISRPDFDRLSSEVEESRPGWYKRGTQYIARALAYSELNFKPAEAQVQANALDDWFEWQSRNPNASDDQAETAYKRIVREYSTLNVEDMLITKRSPSYLVGPRNNPDIDATERATVEAYKRGEIERDELERQALVIHEWRASLEQLRKAATGVSR